MANFWDLPKPVREQIYRPHLVQVELVDLNDFDAACRGNENSIWDYSDPLRRVPRLLQVCKKTEREAAGIYFGENTFIWKRPHDVYQWKYKLWPRHLRLIRSLTIGGWTDPENYKVPSGLEEVQRPRYLEFNSPRCIAANERFGAELQTHLITLRRCGWKLPNSTGMAPVRRCSGGRFASSLHVLIVGQIKAPRVSG